MCLFRTWRAVGARLTLLVLAMAVLAAFSPDPGFAKVNADRKQPHSSQQGRSGTPKVAKKSHRKPHRKVSIPVGDEGMRLNVKAAFLMNMKNGAVYFAQDPDVQIPPASITKVLTLFVLRDAMAQRRLSPDTRIPVSSLAIHTGGSTMTLYKGEKVPLSEIIKGISVVSANNACVAVAEYLGQGDSRRFVAMMNAKARSLGMTRSRFMNPNGLPATGQVSTARDIAKLSAAYLRRYPESLVIHSMTSHTYNGVTHRNANSLLGRYEGVDGLKTGFVCASGYNITATAKRGDTRLVAVVLGAKNPIVREVETARLLEYGFVKAGQEQPGKGSKPSKSSKSAKTSKTSGKSKHKTGKGS